MKTKIAFIAQVVVALPFRICRNDLRLRRGLAAGLGLFTFSHGIFFIIGTVDGTINSMGYGQVATTGVLTLLYAASLLTEKT